MLLRARLGQRNQFLNSTRSQILLILGAALQQNRVRISMRDNIHKVYAVGPIRGPDSTMYSARRNEPASEYLYRSRAPVKKT